tara:strand:+ start:240 stop:482 length:243 start_codon:yes stop_codon:yes gene_type:complete
MSMIGVKGRIIEEYIQLKIDFSNYYEKVHNKKKEFNASKGYDQLGLNPKDSKEHYQILLYSAYAQLRLLIDIKPDLKEIS